MRVIHTADWHLGNNFHNIDRQSEAAAFLSWLQGSVSEYKAQALIVSGDIFDTANPPVWARGLYFDFLAALRFTPCRNVIVIGGNHDSGALLDAPKEVLRAINVHIAGSMTDRTAADCVVPLRDDGGTLIGVCAAIPYMRETELRQYDTGDATPGFMERTLTAVYKQAAEAARELMNGTRVPFIVTGHLFATGLEGRYSTQREGSADDGTRTIDVVGNLGSVSAAVFPASADYTALGHVHYTTMVGGNPKVRYSGSPFCLGFDETHIKRNVLLVDVEAGAPPQVQRIAVPQTYRFERFTGTVQEIMGQIGHLDTILSKEDSQVAATPRYASLLGDPDIDDPDNNPDPRPMFVEIMHDGRDRLDVRAALDEVLQTSPFTVVSYRQMPAAGGGVYVASGEAQTARELSEEEVFKELIKSKNPGLDDDALSALIDEYMPLFMEVANEVRIQSGAGR